MPYVMMKLPTIRRNNITEYSNIKIITIDGPASSGKGTVAKLLAHKLGFHYLDSGSIYRALALFTLNKHLDINNGIDNIVSLIDSMQLEFKNNEIYLNNELVKCIKCRKLLYNCELLCYILLVHLPINTTSG